MYLNKAIIVGNLTREPELKALPSGQKVASFSLATNRTWKDAQGAKQEAVDYHNIVVFGNQAETVTSYLKKGSQVLIEGRIQTRSWDDKETGKKVHRTEIIADRVQFGNKPNEVEKKMDIQSVPDQEIAYPDEDINAEDIPF